MLEDIQGLFLSILFSVHPKGERNFSQSTGQILEAHLAFRAAISGAQSSLCGDSVLVPLILWPCSRRGRRLEQGCTTQVPAHNVVWKHHCAIAIPFPRVFYKETATPKGCSSNEHPPHVLGLYE